MRWYNKKNWINNSSKKAQKKREKKIEAVIRKLDGRPKLVWITGDNVKDNFKVRHIVAEYAIS
jgi:hypothetical protein